MKTTVYWEWEEAFCKFGFGDGDGPNFTNVIADHINKLGYEAEPFHWGIHNYMIQRILDPNGDDLMEGINVGYDCPRTYLPIKLIQALDQEFPGG